ncbi:MAG: hypothetical protein AMK70_05850 [Nitrospira bacterium SG8_35_1]|nr:MAG: hypothetical protein AMK70_05850 [Nitrospira bacterium SG8_35_1]
MEGLTVQHAIRVSLTVPGHFTAPTQLTSPGVLPATRRQAVHRWKLETAVMGSGVLVAINQMACRNITPMQGPQLTAVV